ncbi:MAG TPA: SDR family oxidoreductase [Polyangiaceae bacterium]|nr:SDR family oxidoreductase [Polyangiaceae bacterium]
MASCATGPGSDPPAGIGHNVLLTGATGLLGAQIMRRILLDCPRSRLSLLVRPKPGAAADDRARELLGRALGHDESERLRDRVDVVAGDISLAGMGLSAQDARSLESRVDHVIHCAATIRFDLPLGVARRHNTYGTRNVLDFCERLPRSSRLDYIGTAYVAGRRSGVVREDELDVGQRFWNSYEQTKMEAEALVRRFAERRPAAIYRPSIIVGDSRTGETATFQGLYQLVSLYMRRLVLAIPADPSTHPDLVPVDYVVDALFALMNTRRSIGRCFHLAAGAGNTCSFDELLSMTAEFTKVEPPPYVSFETYHRFVKPLFRAFLWGKKRAAAMKGEYYLPYLSSKMVFDKSNTDALLRGSNVAVSHPRTYFRKLVAFQARALGIAAQTSDLASDARPPVVDAAAARGGAAS